MVGLFFLTKFNYTRRNIDNPIMDILTFNKHTKSDIIFVLKVDQI